ncbi:MAG: hypothetical protein AAGJ28_13355 [Pseudomonadota bacterium]
MRPTTTEKVDRRGGAYGTKDLEQTLDDARQLLGDSHALLQLENDRLFDEARAEDDRVRADKLSDQIGRVNKAIERIIEFDVKSGLNVLGERDAMNLEAARDEILGRLARIIAREPSEGVPG